MANPAIGVSGMEEGRGGRQDSRTGRGVLTVACSRAAIFTSKESKQHSI